MTRFGSVAGLFVLFFAVAATAVDHLEFERDGTRRYVSGRVLVDAQDGGRLLQTVDGTLWTIQPDEIVKESSDQRPFAPLPLDGLTAQLLKELPQGFRSHTTAHYIIAHDTSRAYAVWCGGLFERLHRAFVNYWTRRGMDLHEPEFPLVVIAFADSAAFHKHAAAELGDAATAVLGYYSLQTNRVTMYDLTGAEKLRGRSDRRGSVADINRLLAQPAAEPLVATIVHEATHQVSYNVGLQTRYADNPMWLSEGLAVYFETPDLASRRGWRGIGQVNRRRLATFQQGLAARPTASLASLIASDGRFRDTRTGPAAYAEAWALNHFLIRQRPEEFTAYLQMLAAKPRMIEDDPDTRLGEFKRFFGNNLRTLDADILQAMERLR